MILNVLVTLLKIVFAQIRDRFYTVLYRMQGFIQFYTECSLLYVELQRIENLEVV